MKHPTILTESQLAEARTVKCAEIQELEQILAEKRTQLRRLFQLGGAQEAGAVNMKTWIVKHEGKWPVGACTVVTASSKESAVDMVVYAMVRAEIQCYENQEGWEWISVDTQAPNAVNILNGDY